jgi:hypothetical protein
MPVYRVNLDKDQNILLTNPARRVDKRGRVRANYLIFQYEQE